MIQGLMHAHSGLRWVVLVLVVVSVFMSWFKWNSKAPYGEGDRKLYIFTMLSTHIQLLLGLALYFMSAKVSFEPGFMSNKLLRFYTVEHSLLMVLAIFIITFGFSKSKKAELDTQKHKQIFLYYLTGLALILVSIPWPFRDLGARWF
jgi:membrane-associated HD superfamily phosphohydrolase